MKAFHYGCGVVGITGLSTLSKEQIAKLVSAGSTDKQFIYDEIKGCYINAGGYEFTEEQMAASPLRLTDLGECSLGQEQKQMDEDIEAALLKYLSMFPIALEAINAYISGYLIYYSEGQFIGAHSDNAMAYNGDLPVSGAPIGNTLTCAYILNSDHEGGAVRFRTWGISLSPKAGDILIYPSSFIGAHEVEPIVGGKRCAYISWFGQSASSTKQLQEKLRNMLGGQAEHRTALIGEF
jgi:hypothetical protein